MWEINLELKEYIEQNILPLYEAHDAAHGPEHVRTVLENSFDLLDGLDVDQNMVYTVAAYHDVGVRVIRERHEEISGQWLWEDRELERWFTPEQRRTMREAVEDHRASRQEPPRNIYGRIVSEADRDLDPERVVRRMVEYSLARWPQWTEEEHIERIIDHVRDKYSETGYLHLWLPCPRNEKGLATLREWLRTGELERRCRKYL
jgi:uncharacterized protein